MLSHYTRHDGLIGIGKTNTLWATDFLNLNDGKEFTYGMQAIMQAAVKIVLKQTPSEIRNGLPDEYLYLQIPTYIQAIREKIKQSNGYDTMYVTSFARGRTQHEEDQGILTLWRCYTNTQGYCLQYNLDKIKGLITPEALFYSYAIIDFAEVQYGIDENSSEFQYLAEQYALVLLTQLSVMRGDSRFLRDMPLKHSEIHVTERLLRFCCTHKDPAYIDEREMRLYAIPIDQTLTYGFRPRFPKPLGVNSNGFNYIVFGENRSPPLTPDRIIIGPNASLEEGEISSLFPAQRGSRAPLIIKSNIAIRPDYR